MSETVKYSLELEDNFSRIMEHAEKSAERMEKKLEEIKEAGNEMIKKFAELYILDKGFEFLKESIDDFKRVTIQTALFNKQLENTGKLTKENIEFFKEQREELSKLGFYKTDEVLKFQINEQKNFPNADKGFYEGHGVNVANMAAKQGISIEEADAMLTKMETMRPNRQGELNPVFKEFFKNVGPNEWAKVQKELLKAQEKGQNSFIMKVEEIMENLPYYKGAAETVVKADPTIELHKQIHELSEHLGKLGLEIQKKFLPDMIKAVNWLDHLIDKDFDKIIKYAENIATVFGWAVDHLDEFVDVLGFMAIRFAALKAWDGIKLLMASVDAVTAGSTAIAAAETGVATQLSLFPAVVTTATSSLTTLTIAATKVAGVLAMIALFFSHSRSTDVPTTQAQPYFVTPDGKRYYNPSPARRQELEKQGIPIQMETPQEVEERAKTGKWKTGDPSIDNREDPTKSIQAIKDTVAPIVDKIDKWLGVTDKIKAITKSLSPHTGETGKNPHVPDSKLGLDVKAPKNLLIQVNIHGSLADVHIENTNTSSKGMVITESNKKAIGHQIAEVLSNCLSEAQKVTQGRFHNNENK